jgi:hypothetical protein
VEGVLSRSPDVTAAVVFAVPSRLSGVGEDVGAALILRGDCEAKTSDKAAKQLFAQLRAAVVDELGLNKSPTHWRIVTKEELLMTATGKYIRTGLAAHLGVGDGLEEPVQAERAPPVTSKVHNGLRYLMCVGVMFNHIASAVPDEDSFGPVFGEFKTSTFYFPSTVFFVLGGYALSASLSAKKVPSYRKFYVARVASLYPQYLFALLLSIINLLLVCTPSGYVPKFTFQREEDSLTCQSTPVELSYSESLVSSTIIYSLGLQAWPFFLPFTFFLLYYSWFVSVYLFGIFVFPPVHNWLVRKRGNRTMLWATFAALTFLVYVSCGALASCFSLPEWTKAHNTDEASGWSFNAQNLYALSTIIFPPYWMPTYLSGTVAYFLYDAYRPNESHQGWLFGMICDVLTIAFLAFHIGMFCNKNWPYPEFINDIDNNFGEDHNSGLQRYIWSVLVTRLKVPIIAAWVALMAMPKLSYTNRLFSNPLLTDVLGPAAYGCYLYHQIINQWHFWATRAKPWDWWSFRKPYYWFSPQAMPGAWYEYLYVVGLTTIFSLFVNAYIDPWLTWMWSKAESFVMELCGFSSEGEDSELSALERINEAVEAITGGLSELRMDAPLADVGLGSQGLPPLVQALNAQDKRLNLAVRDLAALDNIGELVALIEAQQVHAEVDAGLGGSVL